MEMQRELEWGGADRHTHTHHAVVRIEIHLIEPSYCSMSPGSACSFSCSSSCCHHLLIYEIFAGFGCKWKSIGPVRGGPSSTSIFPDLTCSRFRSPAVAKQLRGVAHNLLWSVSHLESCQPAGSLAELEDEMQHATCSMLFWRTFLMPIGQFFAINLDVKINLLQ